MSSHSAVADRVEITPGDVGHGVPATIFERAGGLVRLIRRDSSEIGLPAQVREVRYSALTAAGLAVLHSLVAVPGGMSDVAGSLGHFFAAWVTGGIALFFAVRSRWIWIAALGSASLQAFLGVFTLVSAEMPSGMGPFTVLMGVMVSGVVLALLLRRDCYRWFALG